jgi:hypothetical protein
VLKVGVGASEDAGYLRTRVPHFDDRGSFVDLVPLIQARWPALRRPGTCAVRFIRAAIWTRIRLCIAPALDKRLRGAGAMQWQACETWARHCWGGASARPSR